MRKINLLVFNNGAKIAGIYNSKTKKYENCIEFLQLVDPKTGGIVIQGCIIGDIFATDIMDVNLLFNSICVEESAYYKEYDRILNHISKITIPNITNKSHLTLN